jgi:hypothetical protein
VRNYFAFDNGTKPQTKDNQLNNLSGVEEYLQSLGLDKKGLYTIGGYSKSDAKKFPKLLELLKNDEVKQGVLDRMRIGLQVHTQVTGAHVGKHGTIPYEFKPFLVTQAYCSACALGSYVDAPLNSSSWEPFARLVLDAAYESTLAAAVINAVKNSGKPGAKKVYLTRLGGGVFGNNQKWIDDAIERATKLYADTDLEVVVVGKPDPVDIEKVKYNCLVKSKGEYVSNFTEKLEKVKQIMTKETRDYEFPDLTDEEIAEKLTQSDH